jgi:hypothetical protein
VLVAITDVGRARHQERQLVLADAFEQAVGHLGADELMAAAEVLKALSTVYDRL